MPEILRFFPGLHEFTVLNDSWNSNDLSTPSVDVVHDADHGSLMD